MLALSILFSRIVYELSLLLYFTLELGSSQPATTNGKLACTGVLQTSNYNHITDTVLFITSFSHIAAGAGGAQLGYGLVHTHADF
jgi:hypothetical protein